MSKKSNTKEATFIRKRRKARKFQCPPYDVHGGDDFRMPHHGESKEKKREENFRPCHEEIMKSDSFYCSMLLTLYSIANLHFLTRNDDDFYDPARVRAEEAGEGGKSLFK
jgi:hypothetical protein